MRRSAPKLPFCEENIRNRVRQGCRMVSLRGGWGTDTSARTSRDKRIHRVDIAGPRRRIPLTAAKSRAEAPADGIPHRPLASSLVVVLVGVGGGWGWPTLIGSYGLARPKKITNSIENGTKRPIPSVASSSPADWLRKSNVGHQTQSSIFRLHYRK